MITWGFRTLRYSYTNVMGPSFPDFHIQISNLNQYKLFNFKWNFFGKNLNSTNLRPGLKLWRYLFLSIWKLPFFLRVELIFYLFQDSRSLTRNIYQTIFVYHGLFSNKTFNIFLIFYWISSLRMRLIRRNSYF